MDPTNKWLLAHPPGGLKGNGQSERGAKLTTWPVNLDGLIWLDECVRALLAHAVLSTERHPVSDGKGFTEERKKKKIETSWQQEDKTCLQWVCIHILINTNTFCKPGEAIIKQWGKELIRFLLLQEHVMILWLRRRWCYAITCSPKENVLSQCWWEEGLCAVHTDFNCLFLSVCTLARLFIFTAGVIRNLPCLVGM